MTPQLLPAGVNEFKVGRQLVAAGHLYTVERVCSTELIATRLGPGSRQAVGIGLGWGKVVDPTGGATVMLDEEASDNWAQFRRGNQLMFFFRLALVNIVLTGYYLGHESLAADGEPLLEPVAPGTSATVGPRARQLLQLIRTRRDLDWVVTLLHAAQGDHAEDRKPRPRNDYLPEPRSLERWCSKLLHEGVWALMDGRKDRQGGKPEDRARRENSRALVDEVVLASDGQSTLTNSVLRKRVIELAKVRGLPILGETNTLDLIAASLRKHGRTPAQKKSAEYNRTRANRKNQRPLYPGQVYCWDATQADNYVVLRPGTTPIRPWIVCIFDVATGAIVAIFATAQYRSISVRMALFDAFRPLLIAPGEFHGPARVKGHPERIEFTPRAWDATTELLRSPGGIPRTVRADNARQHSTAEILGALKAFKVDLSPSRVGRSTDNAHAEAGFGAFAPLYMDLPEYVGKNAQSRGKDIKGQGAPLIRSYNAWIQRYAFGTFNHQPCTSALGGVLDHGLSRLEAWDALVNTFGELPVLTDLSSLFVFLNRTDCVLTHKGIRLNRMTYSDPKLFELGSKIVDGRGHLLVHHDPRDQGQVYVFDPDTGLYHEIPNTLRDHTDQPLTSNIVEQVLLRANLRNTYDQPAQARFAELIESGVDATLPVLRDLAVHEESRLILQEVRNSGSLIVPSQRQRNPEPDRQTPSNSANLAVQSDDWDAPLLPLGGRG